MYVVAGNGHGVRLLFVFCPGFLKGLWMVVVPLVLLQLAVLQRPYHVVALRDLATTKWTHVCVTGPVVYRRLMRDGDMHVTIDDGTAKVVLEIIPLIPLPVPRKGQTVHACGISRYDRAHRWAEVHPVERITVIH